jgi:DNA-binding MarR family transcriptional regulator
MVNQANATARECAAAVLEAVPHLMRVLRAQVRSESNPDLSMPQFRALAFVGRNAGAMLSDVATSLALTPPAASKLVDGLFTAGLLARETGSEDRRCVALKLTPAGRRKYDAAVRAAEQYLADRIGKLDAVSRGEVLRAMNTLHAIFDDPPEVRRPFQPKRALKV